MNVDATQIAIALGTIVASCGISGYISWCLAKRYGDVAGTNAAIAYEKEKNQRDEAEFRKALSEEIDRNLEQLEDLASSFGDGQIPLDSSGIPDLGPAQTFAGSPSPSWRTEVWSSQVPQVLGAVSARIASLQTFYRALDQITNLHSNLSDLLREQNEFRRNPTGGGLNRQPRPFNDQAPQRWRECKAIIEQSIKKGNPLGER